MPDQPEDPIHYDMKIPPEPDSNRQEHESKEQEHESKESEEHQDQDKADAASNAAVSGEASGAKSDDEKR